MPKKQEIISIDDYHKITSKQIKRRGLGEEDQMHIRFGCLLQKYSAMGMMPKVISWSYLPMGELRKKTTAAMLKKKGVKAGWPDYLFFVYNAKNESVDIIFMEFKTATGKQHESQRNFELLFAGSSNTTYYLARSVQEAINILEKEQILKI
jgi:hypothetical protein